MAEFGMNMYEIVSIIYNYYINGCGWCCSALFDIDVVDQNPAFRKKDHGPWQWSSLTRALQERIYRRMESERMKHKAEPHPCSAEALNSTSLPRKREDQKVEWRLNELDR